MNTVYNLPFRSSADPKYSVDYLVNDTNKDNPVLKMTLKLENYDISTLTGTDGKTGLYLGVGFGTQLMSNADIIMCTYSYKNLATDKFACVDLYTDADRAATVDPDQHVNDVVSGPGLVKASKQTKANFQVTFTRPFATGDANDYQIRNNKIDLIWSIGQIVNGNPVQHNYGGTVPLDLSFVPEGAYSRAETSNSAMSGMTLALSFVIALLSIAFF